MPRRSGIDKPATTVTDILQLHVLYLGPLPLSPANAVFQIDNIIRYNNVQMCIRDRSYPLSTPLNPGHNAFHSLLQR